MTVPRTPLTVVGGTKRRRYTKAEEAAAVGVALAKGQRPASEELGIPLSTLHQWYQSEEYAQLRTTARETVAEQMWAAAQVGVGEMLAGLRDPKTPLRDKTDAVSMLAEKSQLLSGYATSRTERRDITDSMSPDAMDALSDEIDGWLRERAETKVEP